MLAKKRIKIIFAGALCLLAAVIACFCVFSMFGHKGYGEARYAASRYLRALDVHDFAVEIDNRGDAERVWSMRSQAANSICLPEIIGAIQFLKDVPFMVAAADNVAIPAAGGMPAPLRARVGEPHLLFPLLPQDGSHMPRLYASLPHDFEDALDEMGHPVRWRMPEHLLAGYSRLRPATPEPEIVEEKPVIPTMPKLSASAKAGYYRDIVNSFASRFNLSSELVLAIIHSESDFSPSLVSNKSAMGLMQLLPSTASDEVHRFLYGRRGQVSFEQLRVPEINIRYGTAYLHILVNRYFPNVQNRDVQEACVIASYNMGPNRFLRLYGSTNGQAIEKINSMGEEEFYSDLIRRLPVKETRYFVQKVRRMKNHYTSLP